ncbi:MAG: SPOR domain-containing protein [Woeseiaceae bacterium]
MERAAKERLIGAIVLVSVAWLLIPVFLDQSVGEDGAVVERTLELPNGDDADRNPGMASRRTETVDLRAAETIPEERLAVTELPAPMLSQDEAAPVSEAPVDDTPATVKADPDPAAILAAESTESRPVSTEPSSENKPAEVPVAEASQPEKPPAKPPTREPAAVSSPSGGGQLWAVQLGSFGNEANAQKLAAGLRDEGLLAFVSKVQSDGKTLHRVRIGPQATRADSEVIVSRLQAKGQVARVVKHP